jgi:hypothetical protein
MDATGRILGEDTIVDEGEKNGNVVVEMDLVLLQKAPAILDMRTTRIIRAKDIVKFFEFLKIGSLCSVV